MVEEIRNHDAKPTEEESRWMDVEPVSAVVGLMVVAGLALAISISASNFAEVPHKPAKSASVNK